MKNKGQSVNLQQEIDQIKVEIITEKYSMSFGELINLYRDDEINIQPEFQRLFRWTDDKKSKLIESILIGIPIPPIFVSQKASGIWEVVDGVQRLSTIFQFAGILRGDDQSTEPLILEGTQYLPSLEGQKWDDKYDDENSFSPDMRIQFKRARIDVIIILEDQKLLGKYELFQRLNTGGVSLTNQELRNSILTMENMDLFHWITGLSEYENFKKVVNLSDKQLSEKINMELILKFVIFRQLKPNEMKINDVSSFLTNKMIELAKLDDFPYEIEKQAFETTFDVLADSMAENSLRKYDHEANRFTGSFQTKSFEAVAGGIAFNYKHFPNKSFNIENKVKELWRDKGFATSYGRRNVTTRLPKTLAIGRELFKP